MDNIYLEKIRAAKINLILKHAFFGQMATKLNFICDNVNFKTAATDGRNFYYNEQFIGALNTEEMLFLFGHEVLHNVFEHHYRRGSRNPTLWNIAADYVINLILVDAKLGKPPTLKKGGVLLSDKYRNMTTEEVYDLLFEKSMSCEELNDLVNRLLDEHPDFIDGKTPEEIEEIRREMKEKLLSSTQVAGSLPAGVERYIKSFTEPKINWVDKLRMELSSTLKRDYTFLRVNKKSTYGMGGFILPGNERTSGIEICIGIDMSGSITDEIAKEFLSEVNGIMSQFDDYKIEVWSFDTEIYNHESYASDGLNNIEGYIPKGGGGTDFEANWKYMKAHDITPKIFLMFTDMCPYGSWGDPNYCDTIFVSRGNRGTIAPFGLTVEMD
jgi:predicted metal-dependent peptidase